MNYRANATLISYDEIVGSEPSKVIDKMGLNCSPTDFAIVLGAYTDKANEKNIPLTWWWIRSGGYNGHASCVDPATGLSFASETNRHGGVRPVINCPSKLKGIRNDKGVLEVEYGEYPQTIADSKISKKLEDNFSKGILKKTGKNYTIDATDSYKQFEEISYRNDSKRCCKIR